MRITPETYRGIEFVRLSQFPNEERQRIFSTIAREKIIKILRDKELLNDCIQVSDYKEWLSSQPKAIESKEVREVESVLKSEALKLAFK